MGKTKKVQSSESNKIRLNVDYIRNWDITCGKWAKVKEEVTREEDVVAYNEKRFGEEGKERERQEREWEKIKKNDWGKRCVDYKEEEEKETNIHKIYCNLKICLFYYIRFDSHCSTLSAFSVSAL